MPSRPLNIFSSGGTLYTASSVWMSQIFVCLNDQANNCLIHLYNKDMPLIGQNTVGQTAAGLTVQMAGEAV